MLLRILRLAAALAVLVLLGAGSTRAVPGASAQGDTQGDVTCDSSVNSVDSLQILRDVAGLGTTAGCLASAGDVNCDTAVDSVDALRILRHVAGLTNTTPDGCIPIGEPLGMPTSEALIAQALADGDITFDESLLYRAYGLYDHPDLPDEFRSTVVDYHAALGLFTDVLENEATLSPQLLDDLAPFTARPADPISIFNNPPARQGQVSAAIATPWVSMPAAGGKARVWVKQSALANEQLDDYAKETTRVWNALDGIFRYGLPDTPGAADVNPDSAIDLYFADVGDIDPRDSHCQVVPLPPAGCFVKPAGGYTGYVAPKVGRESASFVMIDANVRGPMLISHIAHELMHVGQHTYDVYEPFWLKDSTAAWGAVRVLQKLKEDREPNFDYLPDFFKGLDKTLTRTTEEDLNQYASWLFFFFASMEKGNQIVTKIWEQAAAAGKQNERAVDQVFKFDSYFDNFTVQNWNQKPPLTIVYADEDDTFPDHKPKPEPLVSFGGPDESKIEEELEPLSARYYRYQFGAPVKSVIFHNKLKGKPHAHLWGIAKVNGEWQEPEDWTDLEEKGWCLDVPSQHLEELIVVFSNSDMTGKVTSSESSVEAKASGCTNWRGTIRWTFDPDQGYSDTSVADVYFRNDQPPGTSTCDVQGADEPCEVYYASGTVTYNSHLVDALCTDIIGPATATIARGEGMLIVYTEPDPQTYEGTGMSRVTGPRTVACPGDPTQSSQYNDFDIWFRAPPDMFHVKEQGTIIEETYTYGTTPYTWRLEPAP